MQKLIGLLCVACLTSGCGFKGPLYMPEPIPEPVTDPAADSATTTQKDNDGTPEPQRDNLTTTNGVS